MLSTPLELLIVKLADLQLIIKGSQLIDTARLGNSFRILKILTGWSGAQAADQT